MDSKNQQLLALLQRNARESTSSLARKLNLSRTAVQERINRLEQQGVIAGYTVELNKQFQHRQIRAWVAIRTKQRLSRDVVHQLEKIPEITSLRTVNGIYDMLATIEAESPQMIDEVLDLLAETDGIEKTFSSIELSVKFER